jgi:hypothetical protein
MGGIYFPNNNYDVQMVPSCFIIDISYVDMVWYRCCKDSKFLHQNHDKTRHVALIYINMTTYKLLRTTAYWGSIQAWVERQCEIATGRQYESPTTRRLAFWRASDNMTHKSVQIGHFFWSSYIKYSYLPVWLK